MVAFGRLRHLLIGAALVAAPASAFAQFSIAVNIAPPVLPVYAQPICPGNGYLWTPGYWAYGPEGYFWVPGVWVVPPTVGYLWTPAYWGYMDNGYRFFPGYWAPHIGFYGGVNYGFGYFGHGYEGGYWDRDRFFYNRSVNNINERYERNVYIRDVHVENRYNRVSYNGGNGIQERPRSEELQAQRERHFEPTPVQLQHQQFASRDREQFAAVNGGRPQVQAARTPEEFQQHVQRGGFGGSEALKNGETPLAQQPGQRGLLQEHQSQQQQPQIVRQIAPQVGPQPLHQPSAERGQWQGRQPLSQPLSQGQPQMQRQPPSQVQPPVQRIDGEARQRQAEAQQRYQQQAQRQQMRQQQYQQQARQYEMTRQQQAQQHGPPQPMAQPQARPQEGGRPERAMRPQR